MKAQTHTYRHECKASDLTDAQLLAGLIGCSVESAMVKIKEQGSFSTVLHDHGKRLPAKQQRRAELTLEAMRRYQLDYVKVGDVMYSPERIRNFLAIHMMHEQSERFAIMFLTTRHHLIKFETLFYGTIDCCTVHTREIVRAAIHHNAGAVIIAHNHPSGNPEPSKGDERITRRLQKALALIDVRVLDHFVVGKPDIISFVERGLI